MKRTTVDKLVELLRLASHVRVDHGSIGITSYKIVKILGNAVELTKVKGDDGSVYIVPFNRIMQANVTLATINGYFYHPIHQVTVMQDLKYNLFNRVLLDTRVVDVMGLYNALGDDDGQWCEQWLALKSEDRFETEYYTVTIGE